MIETDNGRIALVLDERGAIRALRDACGRDLLVTGGVPAFALQYLDGDGRFHVVTSDDAASVEHDGLRTTYRGVGAPGFAVTLAVRLIEDAPMTAWTLELTQPDGVVVADVQFPYAVTPYRDGGTLLLPIREGRLLPDPRPDQLPPDHPSVWRFGGPTAFDHYPGTTAAQFLAYYDDLSGVYLAAHDPDGGVKNLKAVHHPAGLRLGLSHVVGWAGAGTYALGYETVLGAFTGDWHTAADLYRGWYEAARKPTRLADRADVPGWLLDGPVHVILRAQGELDTGPATPQPEVTPITAALPWLDALADRIGGPVLPVVMAWEGPGPWVYPESFPVAGGDQAMRDFTAGVRERGWHAGTYCNGTQWVTEHLWTGYDGWDLYRSAGAGSVARTPSGRAWRNGWDAPWRTSFTGCAAAPATREQARAYVGRLIDLGFDWVQFLDQNCGAAAFPCYARDHGHPPAPGRWMTEALDAILDDFDDLAGRQVAYSVEGPPNDYALSRFAICDIRPDLNPGSVAIPLYQYLFHEYVLTQATFAPAPNPYAAEIRTATSFVHGDVPSAILGRDGRLNTWSGTESMPWSLWDSAPGDQDAALRLLWEASALRRGAGREYLVLGRMLAASPVRGDVLHAAWQAADGRRAVALANWTRTPVTVEAPPGRLHLGAGVAEVAGEIVLPELSVALLELAT